MNDRLSEQEEARYAELQQLALDFARCGDSDGLEKMLDAGMPINLADGKGNSLLMLASYHGESSTVDLLIRYGADPNRRNDRGQTPIGGVAFKGFTDIAELLIKAGADLSANNGAGMKPIHFAAMFGRFEMVRLLEKHGPSLKQPDGNQRLHNRIMPFVARSVSRIRSIFSVTPQ